MFLHLASSLNNKKIESELALRLLQRAEKEENQQQDAKPAQEKLS
jgi:hypothetical protein